MIRILLFQLLVSSIIYSQETKNNQWLLFSEEYKVTKDVNETDNFNINNLTFEIAWDKDLSYSENIGYYGGIKSLTIYKNDKKLQTFRNIEDEIALGTISIDFYDYNLDGFIDFTLPINENWNKYFIYNPITNMFEHLKDWDYLKIQKIDKINKQIISHPDGNALDINQKQYQIIGLKLVELKP